MTEGRSRRLSIARPPPEKQREGLQLPARPCLVAAPAALLAQNYGEGAEDVPPRTPFGINLQLVRSEK